MAEKPQPTDPDAVKRGKYAEHLSGLRDQVEESGLSMPTGRVRVIPGTEDEGRPLGADLPVYPQGEVDTSERGMKKALFNLRSLTGFKPPTRKRS